MEASASPVFQAFLPASAVHTSAAATECTGSIDHALAAGAFPVTALATRRAARAAEQSFMIDEGDAATVFCCNRSLQSHKRRRLLCALAPCFCVLARVDPAGPDRLSLCK